MVASIKTRPLNQVVDVLGHVENGRPVLGRESRYHEVGIVRCCIPQAHPHVVHEAMQEFRVLAQCRGRDDILGIGEATIYPVGSVECRNAAVGAQSGTCEEEGQRSTLRGLSFV